MEYIEHEVKFAEYCYKCKYADMAEDSYPCDDCLGYPVNTYSRKPVRFVPSDETEGTPNRRSKADA